MTPTPETPQTVRDAAEILENQGFQKAASRLRAAADAWEALIKQIEGLTAGGSEYVNDPSRCLEEVQQRLKLVGRVAAERNALREQLATSEQARQAAEKDTGEVKAAFVELCERVGAASKCQRSIQGDPCLRCGGTDWVCAEELDAALASKETP